MTVSPGEPYARFPVDIFVSYSPTDEEHRQELEKHLAILKQSGGIRVWHSGLVAPGQGITAETRAALDRAQLILLLVSADYLTERWSELQIALDRHTTGRARVIPIIVRSCDWTHGPFSQLQPLPRDGRAATSWSNPNAAWADIAYWIRTFVATLVQGPPPPLSPAAPLPPAKQIDGGLRAPKADADAPVVGMTLPSPGALELGPASTLLERPSASQAAYFEGPGRVPVLPVPHFVGRAAEMTALRAALSEDGGAVICAVICGLGGIGKTALAHQFLATEAKALFRDGSVWLDGTSLPQEAARAAQRFGWNGARPPSLEDAGQWLARELHDRHVLVVIDNVDVDPDRTSPRSIPLVGGRSRTVITTRAVELHNDLSAPALPIVVGSWTAMESRVFLREIAPKLATSSDADIDALASFVGDLPLAVGLLSKLLRRKGETPGALLGRLEREPLGTLDKASNLAGRGVVATFQAAFHELDPSERKVLIALASCARATSTRVVARVASMSADATLVALSELEQQSLVEYADDSARPWGLHDIVRIFVRAQVGTDNADAGHLIFVEEHVARHEDATAWEEMEGEMMEVFTAVDRLLSKGDGARACSIMEGVQNHLVQRGRYAKLLDIYQRLLPLLPEGERAYTGVLGNMSNCYSEIGDTANAFRCLEPLPAIHEKLGLVGAQANDFGNLGVFCAKIGDHTKAIAYHERALTIYEELEDLLGQASQLGNLGNCYFEIGELTKAIDLGKRALALAMASTSLRAQARQLGNLGSYLLKGREPQEALVHLQRALEINEQLGRLVEQARNLAYLGLCYEQLGDMKSAVDLVQRALSLFREAGVPEDHSMIQNALSTLKRLISGLEI